MRLFARSLALALLLLAGCSKVGLVRTERVVSGCVIIEKAPDYPHCTLVELLEFKPGFIEAPGSFALVKSGPLDERGCYQFLWEKAGVVRIRSRDTDRWLPGAAMEVGAGTSGELPPLQHKRLDLSFSADVESEKTGSELCQNLK